MGTARRRQYTSTPGKARLAIAPPCVQPGDRPDHLVVSAWAPELAFLRKELPQLSATLRRDLALGTLGVGLVEAAIGASQLLATLRPRAVILVGTAGLYPVPAPGHGPAPSGMKRDSRSLGSGTTSLTVGVAVVARKIVLLTEPLAGDHVYLPDIMPSRERTSPSLTNAIRKTTALAVADLACPLAITRSAQASAFAAEHSGCALENLEAFALARAATRLKIPFAVVVGIANHVGPAAHREWKKNAAHAAEAACRAVLAYLSGSP